MVTRKPTTLLELRNLLDLSKPKLSRDQMWVARSALARPEMVAFGTARSLSETCGVSASTVARLAISIGFASFKDFKRVFREHVRVTGLGREGFSNAISVRLLKNE